MAVITAFLMAQMMRIEMFFSRFLDLFPSNHPYVQVHKQRGVFRPEEGRRCKRFQAEMAYASIGEGHEKTPVLICERGDSIGSGMVMASFVRAKAESVGGLKSCTVGVAERQEKLILLVIGSFLEPIFPIALPICVVTVGVLSHVTVIQRLRYTFNQTRGIKVDF